MSRRQPTTAELQQQYEQQLQRTKAIKQRLDKAITADKAKHNANIIKALEYANGVGMFGGVTQPWDTLADLLIRQADKYVQKQQQQQGPAV